MKGFDAWLETVENAMPILIFNEVLMRPLAGVMPPRLLRNRMTIGVPLRPMFAIRVFQPKVFMQANMQ